MEPFCILMTVVDIYLYTLADIPRSIYHRVDFSACKLKNLSLPECLFQKHRVNKSIYYVAFQVCFLSLSKVHLRLTPVTVCESRSSRFLSEGASSSGRAAVIIRQLVEGHLRCSRRRSVVTGNAAINIHTAVSA